MFQDANSLVGGFFKFMSKFTSHYLAIKFYRIRVYIKILSNNLAHNTSVSGCNFTCGCFYEFNNIEVYVFLTQKSRSIFPVVIEFTCIKLYSHVILVNKYLDIKTRQKQQLMWCIIGSKQRMFACLHVFL